MGDQDQNKRRRQQKISNEQKEIYCSFMEENPWICTKKNCDASVQDLWQTLGVLLNSTGGAHHTVEEWKKVFDNWRYSVTYKLRLQKADTKATGGGSPILKKPIDRLEERAMACWGRIIVDGHKNVGVAGCSKFEPLFEMETGATVGAAQTDDDPGGIVDLDVDVADLNQKPKRQKKSTTNTLDDEFMTVLQNSEEKRQVQADFLCTKLEEVVESIDALTAAQRDTAAAQRATTAAIEALTRAINSQN